MERFIVLDVEGMQGKRPYNVGYIIADRRGRIYKRHSFAFPVAFWENIAESLRTGAAIEMTKQNIQEILQDANNVNAKRKYKQMTTDAFTVQFFKEIKHYDITRIFAYNSRFDEKAIFNLIGEDAFAELGLEWCDIISGILPRILTKKYIKWAIKNGYTTPTGLPSYKAEIVYRYLFGKYEFVEEHTGLSDALIEYEILLSAFRSKKKLNFTPTCAWRKFKEMMKGMS